jgi:hypothetical protein
MKKEEIISKVKALSFPEGEYVVFGSCPLAVAGIREANDIDMLISPALYAQLEKAGWQQLDKGEDDKPLTHDVFEVHENWNFSTYAPTLDDLKADANIVDGVPFASLAHVRKWKDAWGRPKDMEDVRMIDEYLSKN